MAIVSVTFEFLALSQALWSVLATGLYFQGPPGPPLVATSEPITAEELHGGHRSHLLLHFCPDTHFMLAEISV